MNITADQIDDDTLVAHAFGKIGPIEGDDMICA